MPTARRRASRLGAVALLLGGWSAALGGGKAIDELKGEGGAGRGAAPRGVAVGAVVSAGASAPSDWSEDPAARRAQLQKVFDAVLAWYREKQGFAKPVALKYLPDEFWGDPSGFSPAASKPPGAVGAAAGGPGDILTVRVGASIFEATAGRPDPERGGKPCRGPDQAAFVLGHELGHLAQGHWEALDDALTKADRRFWADGGPGQELERLASLEQAGRATSAQKARIKELRKLQDAARRSDELQRPLEDEADALGVKAAAGVGADPAAGAAFMLNMADLFGKKGIRFDASHDSPQARAARIRRLAAGLKESGGPRP